jgi:hypothetical protein
MTIKSCAYIDCKENDCYDWVRVVGGHYVDFSGDGVAQEKPNTPFCTKWVDYNGGAFHVALSLLLLLVALI